MTINETRVPVIHSAAFRIDCLQLSRLKTAHLSDSLSSCHFHLNDIRPKTFKIMMHNPVSISFVLVNRYSIIAAKALPGESRLLHH